MEKTIQKNLTDGLVNSSHSIVEENYKKILSKKRQMVIRINKIKRHLDFENHQNKYRAIIDNNKDAFDEAKKDELKSWINNKFQREEKQLLNDFKAAYSLIEEIRELITGEPIEYIIIEESLDKKIGSTHIEILKLDSTQMLKNLQLGYNALSKYSGNILSTIKTVETRQIVSRYKEKTIYSKTSPLYTSLSSLFEIADPNQSTFNQGNRWEIYYYFLNKNNGNDNIPVQTIEEFMNALSASKAGYSWYKGGDVGNYQVKSTGASFTSFNSVVFALEHIVEILSNEKLSISQQMQEMQKLFTVSKDKELEDIAKRLASDKYLEIEQLVANEFKKLTR